jgi:hypothetical protein
MSESTASSTAGGPASAPRASAPAPTAWVGWIWFAGIVLITVGLFNIIDGLVALFRGDLFTVGPGGLLVLDLTAWGWVHLIIGIVQVLIAFPLLRGAAWARSIVVLLAMLNAVTQLAFLSAYPIWSLIVIALDVVVIWAVVVHGDEVRQVDQGW